MSNWKGYKLQNCAVHDSAVSESQNNCTDIRTISELSWHYYVKFFTFRIYETISNSYLTEFKDKQTKFLAFFTYQDTTFAKINVNLFFYPVFYLIKGWHSSLTVVSLPLLKELSIIGLLEWFGVRICLSDMPFSLSRVRIRLPAPRGLEFWRRPPPPRGWLAMPPRFVITCGVSAVHRHDNILLYWAWK